MKVIIAGSRHYNNRAVLEQAIAQSGFEITEVVSGHASGVDLLGEEWAQNRGIPVKTFPITQADWDRYGYAAGPIRNGEMARYAEALIALPCGESKGTRNMIKQAKQRGLQVYVKEVTP